MSSRSSDLGKNERLLKDADEAGAKNQNDIVEYRSRSRRIETDKVVIEEVSKRAPAAYIMEGTKEEVASFITNTLKSKRGSRGLVIFKDQRFRKEQPEEFDLVELPLTKKSTKESLNVAKNYNDIGARMALSLSLDTCYGVSCELVKDGIVINTFSLKKEEVGDEESPIFTKKKKKEETKEEVKEPTKEDLNKAYVLHYYLPVQ